MRWELEWQEKNFVVQAAIERGQPIPEWLQNEPLLLPGDEFYMSAFYELSTCRSYGWTLGPIPWRDIIFYAQYAGLEEDLLPVFVRSLRAMDTVYMEYIDKKTPGGKK